MHQLLVHSLFWGQERRIELREQLRFLIELQKTEREIERLHVRSREILNQIARLEEDYNSSRTWLEGYRKKLAEVQKAHREQEEKLKRGMEGLKRTKERLGEVKTNKEYQAILKEIEIWETKNSEIEDEIIRLLEEMDKAKEELKEKEREFEEISRRYEEEKRNFMKEMDSLAQVLCAEEEHRAELVKKIEREFLERYETIKKINSGIAVVPVWKEICEGCHMNIPPQLYIELQKSIGEELHFCPHCNRIIYWVERNNDGSLRGTLKEDR